MKILVIDPGAAAGWAAFDEHAYIESGICCGDPSIYENLQYMCQIVTHVAPDMLVIETQFGMPGRGTKNLVPLLERRFVWETLCRLRCCQIRHVVPSVWQRHFGLIQPRADTKNKTEKEKRKLAADRSKKVKEEIVKLARKKARKKAIQENEADAVAMGFYAIDLLGQGKLVEKIKGKRRKKKRNG